MGSLPARSVVTFKWYNLECSNFIVRYNHTMETICQLHFSLYVTQFNECIHYLPEGDIIWYGYKTLSHLMVAYKIPPLLMRVVTKSILVVHFSIF